MNLDRRTFLKAAAAAPCVFGLQRLFGQDSEAGPEWFRKALARMKERKLHGVVLVAPAEAEKQVELGRRLWDLLDGDFPEAHELLLNGVFIVMTPSLVESSGVRAPEEKEDRFLLDPEGKRIAADVRDPRSIDAADAFVAAFAPFLYGGSNERLKSRADEAGASAPPEVFIALKDLGAEELATREAASAALLERAADLVPLYAWKRRVATDAEIVSRLKSIIERHYRTIRADQTGPRLPFGTRIPQFREGGCGQFREVVENEKEDTGPMVACGMGRIEDRKVRMFLRFLTK